MIRKAKAVWRGTGRAGSGHLSTDSGVLAQTPYSFKTRFESEKRTNPEELIAVAHAGFGFDELVADTVAEAKGVEDVLPVAAAKNERFSVLLLPLKQRGCHAPPGIKMYVFDSADIGGTIHPDSPAQGASYHAADSMAAIHLRPNLNAVVGVHKGYVLHRVIEPLQMKRPGIRVDVGSLLLGVVHGQAPDHRAAAQFEKRGVLFLISAAGCQQNGASQGCWPARRIVDALQAYAGRDGETACHQVFRCRQPQRSSGLSGCVQRPLDRAGVVRHAVRLDSEAG